MYKTVVIEYTPGADKMAEKIEETANAMYEQGYTFITMSITPSAKAILVFKKIERINYAKKIKVKCSLNNNRRTPILGTKLFCK